MLQIKPRRGGIIKSQDDFIITNTELLVNCTVFCHVINKTCY